MISTMDKINKLFAAMFLGLSSLLLMIILFSVIIEHRDKEYNPKTILVTQLLKPYVKEYIDSMESNDVRIPWGNDLVLIDFTVSLPNSILGIAHGMDINNITLIGINLRTWNGLKHEEKRLLMFHELTHDVFNIEHFETPLMDTPMPKYVTRRKVDAYLRELIKYIKK